MKAKSALLIILVSFALVGAVAVWVFTRDHEKEARFAHYRKVMNSVEDHDPSAPYPAELDLISGLCRTTILVNGVKIITMGDVGNCATGVDVNHLKAGDNSVIVKIENVRDFSDSSVSLTIHKYHDDSESGILLEYRNDDPKPGEYEEVIAIDGKPWRSGNP